jgi:hypothetical protein
MVMAKPDLLEKTTPKKRKEDRSADRNGVGIAKPFQKLF